MKNLRKIIRKLIRENTHRCISGQIVDSDSVECYEDVCIRIDDLVHTRDIKPRGTASRAYYNGILSDLRKEKRRLQKIHRTDISGVPENDIE